MGTFYWQARRKWAAQVTMTDGKRSTATCPHEHPTRGRGPCQEARDLLVELERLKAQHAPSNARTLTLGAFLNGWLADVKDSLAPATYRKYESICGVVGRDAVSNLRLSELSVADVQACLRRAGAKPSGIGPRTQAHYRATLRRALADGLRQGLVSRNVAALTRPVKVGTPERTILTAEQCRTLIEGTRDDRLHALYVLAVTTGMREAEMLGLTWEDVDLGDVWAGMVGSRLAPDDPNGLRGPHPLSDMRDQSNAAPRQSSVSVAHTLQRVEGEWKLMPPKTDKSRRTIPLTPVAVAALKAHRQRQMEERLAAGKPGKEGLVFTTPSGLPIHGSNLLPDFRRHLARLGLPKVTIHDLRHSAATLLFAQGIPLEVISDILGHSTTRVTGDLYRHRVPQLSVEAARKMQEAVG